MLVAPSSLPFESPEKYEFLVNAILPVGLEYYQKRLKVNTTGKLPVLGSSTSSCTGYGGITIPDSIKNEAQETDYILFIGVENEPDRRWLAYAAPCIFSKFCCFKLI